MQKAKKYRNDTGGAQNSTMQHNIQDTNTSTEYTHAYTTETSVKQPYFGEFGFGALQLVEHFVAAHHNAFGASFAVAQRLVHRLG